MKAGTLFLSIFLAVALIFSISGCGKQTVSDSPVGKTESAEVSAFDSSDDNQKETNTSVSEQSEDINTDEDPAVNTTASDASAADESKNTQKDKEADTQEDKEAMLQMRIGDTAVTVEWEDNESVQALRDLCTDNPLTIQMSMYGGFEQVGSIGQSLPRNDRQTTTGAGDIVLYSGNQIVVFYGSNSWAYTRLGHITDQNVAGMTERLGNGDVTITISKE